MIINEKSDWKYLIPFDAKIYKQVLKFAENLPDDCKYIMLKSIEFYRNHFTFEQMYNVYLKVKKDDDKLEQLKQFVYKNNKCLLYCPRELVIHYGSIIKEKHYEDRYFLNKILKYCGNVRPDYAIKNYYKIIFGKYYKGILKRLKGYAGSKAKPVEDEKVNKYLLMYQTDLILKSLRKDIQVHDEFGISKIRECKSLVKTKFGFGSWHSKEILGEDYFTIHSNNHNLTQKQLEKMVYTNIYPGKAHFYNNILTTKFKYTFDNGANFLTNGWGTYCSWNTRIDQHTKYNRYINCKITKYLFAKDYQKGLNELYCFLLNNFEKKQALEMYIYITQYPGKFESHYLGALAIEQMIKKKFAENGADVIQKLKNRDCGDYFATYIKQRGTK